ncbi:type I secretion system permease/ATPase [Azonexus hydrophilus]|uniref:type I secretion system permease/ATPase n=1 Tax=Azonexus hydrophilus TaxID=418702 RepID=UPI000422285B|nr:type I secretion system permease/ATPase [Azonexus hydrophilus]
MLTVPHQTIRLSLRACRDSFINVGLFSMCINIAMLVPAIYMLQVYDRVVVGASMPTLYMLTLLMLVFLIAMGVLEWARQDIMRRVSNRLDLQLAPLLFDVGYRQAWLSAGMAAGTQPLQDLKGIRQFVSSHGLFAFFDTPWVPVYLLVMFAFHPWIGLIGLLSALLLLGITLANERLTGQHQKAAEQAYHEAGRMLTQVLRNSEVMSAMGMLSRLRQRWLSEGRGALVKQNAAAEISSILTAVSKSLRIIIQSLILGLGAYLAIRQEISPGMMIAGSILLGRALAPIDQMLGSWKQFATAREQYQRLNASLHADPAPETRMTLPTPRGEVRVEDIVVTAPGGNSPLLSDVSFHCAPGTIVGVIGPSAAGKSTLARALLGIWPCVKGSVRLDGAEIHGWNKDELGSHIGYLPQDIELFEGSVSDNIARFGPADPEKVVQAARDAGIHDMILRLPQGYDTQLGNGGSKLSGGQRQRLGIARAIYGRPCLIVLDEPNANLDHVGEEALLETLDILRENASTVFLITHKTRILSATDKLLVLADGSLSMFGPRDRVLAELNKLAPVRQIKEAWA